MNPWNPKFPWNNEADNGYGGLTKREYFAAMAMQGLLANRGAGNCDYVCQVAVYHADELIRQLNPR